VGADEFRTRGELRPHSMYVIVLESARSFSRRRVTFIAGPLAQW
jgi:hypothetical protein